MNKIYSGDLLLLVLLTQIPSVTDSPFTDTFLASKATPIVCCQWEWEGGREGGRKGGREGGMEGGREGGASWCN